MISGGWTTKERELKETSIYEKWNKWVSIFFKGCVCTHSAQLNMALYLHVWFSKFVCFTKSWIEDMKYFWDRYTLSISILNSILYSCSFNELILIVLNIWKKKKKEVNLLSICHATGQTSIEEKGD